MPPRSIKLAGGEQTICDGNHINRFVAINQNGNLAKNSPVFGTVKIAGIHQLGNRIPALGGQ